MNSTEVASSRRSCRDQIQHLGLHRGIEAGRRLVEDQQLRIDRQRHGDGYALLHAARKLMRIAVEDRSAVGDPHAREHLGGALARAAAASPSKAKDLGHLLADPNGRIEGARRDPDRPSTRCVARSWRSSSWPSAMRSRPSTRMRPPRHPAVARQIAHDGQRHGRLAAAGLADQSVSLARADAKAQIAQHAGRGRERGRRHRGARRERVAERCAAAHHASNAPLEAVGDQIDADDQRGHGQRSNSTVHQ